MRIVEDFTDDNKSFYKLTKESIFSSQAQIYKCMGLEGLMEINKQITSLNSTIWSMHPLAIKVNETKGKDEHLVNTLDRMKQQAVTLCASIITSIDFISKMDELLNEA